MTGGGPRAEVPERTPSPVKMRHTARTLLNNIIGYSEMLLVEAQERDLEGFVAELQNIHTSGKQLLDLIDDLFDSTGQRTQA